MVSNGRFSAEMMMLTEELQYKSNLEAYLYVFIDLLN